MALQHAILDRYVDIVPRPVTTVPSNIYVVIGTAPTYRLLPENIKVNVPQQCIGAIDDFRYAGPKTPGFTIPHALDALRDNDGGTAIIINVFNAAIHKTTATTISHTFANDLIQLRKVTGSVPIPLSQAEGLTGTISVGSYAEGADYSVDRVLGQITRIKGGTIPANANVNVTYTYADPTKVTASEIIGAIVNGERTGMQGIYDIYNLFGFTAKLIVCPIFNENAGVAAELIAIAEKTRAYVFLDAPAGVTRDEAIAGRSGTAPVGTFSSSSDKVVLCYPRVRASDDTLQPLSQYAAALAAGVDKDEGYHFSPSNHVIQGITGLETRLSGDYTSADTDINALNAAGITTVFGNSFGTGYRLWGNRTASYPSDTSPLNFIPVGRTVAIGVESIKRSSLPYLDKPISTALIDQILAGGNNYIREQIQLGALVSGSEMVWTKDNNLKSQIAAGRLTFNIIWAVPTPAETIIYEHSIDIDLYDNILPTTTEA